jgi:hypothetical protein
MKRRTLIDLLTAMPLALALPAQAATQIQVYKNPSCGCCTAWADHLKAAGFAVSITETADTGPLRKRLGVPDRLAGCHTGVVEGYALEGHVPAAEVKRLLALKPNAVGLAVPGMPVGSPGMEDGDLKQAYQVILIGRNTRDTVFARYPK